MKRERRFEKGIEIRQDGDKPVVIRGYAARFNSLSNPLGGFVEKIARGAFAKAIGRDDVRALFNHDSNLILGRNKSGTLVLSEDENGLYCEITPPDTTVGRDLVESIKRGDIDGMSFAFSPVDDSWGKTDDGVPLRTLREVALYDVSPVTFPAYPETSVSARSAMFPDGVPEVPKDIEKRDNDSFEETIWEVSDALAQKFPAAVSTVDGSPMAGGRYWVVETYSDYVIVVECQTWEYFRISYSESDDDAFTFGDPVAVEKEWAPRAATLAKLEKRKAEKPTEVPAPEVKEEKPAEKSLSMIEKIDRMAELERNDSA